MIRYVIIDDEPIAHGIIEGFADAMQHLQEQQVDMLFLDINMPKLSGLDFLRTLNYQPKVIITSAYKEFALDSYEFDVVDYLLKPFSFERFVKAINKVSFSKSELKSNTEDEPKHLFIKGDKKQHQVVIDDILFIEASGNYCKVVLEDEIIITLQKISDFETMLPAYFIRTHKSYIVSKNKIKAIEGNVIHLKEHRIPIGLTYKSIIKNLYNN